MGKKKTTDVADAATLIKELNDKIQSLSQSGVNSEAVYWLKDKSQNLYDNYGPVETTEEKPAE